MGWVGNSELALDAINRTLCRHHLSRSQSMEEGHLEHATPDTTDTLVG